MKTTIYSPKALLMLLLLALCTACGSDDKDLEELLPSLTIADEQLAHSVTCDKNTVTIPFTATAKWKAEVADNADWIYPERSSGEAGSVSLKVTITANGVAQERSAALRLSCGNDTKEVTFRQAANEQGEEPTDPDEKDTMNSSEVKDFEKYYKPKEFSSINMLKRNAKWSWFRHKQSEHFFVFWEAGFGDDPNSADVPANLRVDIDDLLVKAEQFYKTNVETLKMADVTEGKSYLTKYKMEIYLLYQEEWLATGSGYDNVIGALWVNPSTCQPVGSTIAHEIGHSFQYQVYCDKMLQGASNDFNHGFRYGYPGSNGGCGYWEQCAQWQSYQDYPEQVLANYHFEVWLKNCHRHFENEWMRYASYWLPYYWTQKHGIEMYGEIWRQSAYPDDAIATYTRLYNSGSWEETRKELYDYAARMATFDIDRVRNYADGYQGKYATKFYTNAEGAYQVAYASCPSTTGFNVVALNVPQAGTTVTVDFKGLAVGSALAADDPGTYMASEEPAGTVNHYNNVAAGLEGWAYGFVALKQDGTRVYGEMNTAREATASFTVPAGTERLFLVVQGAPTEYRQSPWDEKELTDDQWPYQVKFGGTDLLGNFNIDETAQPTDLTLTYNLTCQASSADYQQGIIDLQANGDIQKLAQAFVLKAEVLSGKTQAIANGTTQQPQEGLVVLGLEQADGSMNYTYTANSGFYITAEGNQGSWSNGDPLWVEYDKDAFTLTYGHFPGKSVAGTKYTVKPTLVYTRDGKQYKATFVLNMQF